MLHLTFIKYLYFVSIALLITSCSPTVNLATTAPSLPAAGKLEEVPVTVEDVLKGDNLVVISNKDQLYVVDPDFAKPIAIYTFNNEEKPTVASLDSFTISPNKQWVVWYAPSKGVLALNIPGHQITVLNPPSDFLNTNPYIEFMNGNDTVQFITNSGNTLTRIHLPTLDREENSIPYPYGNLFKTSGDNKYTLFIAGYGQSLNEPKFMIADHEGTLVDQFTTKTNIGDRHWVFWDSTSKGVLMINNHTLELYSLSNLQQPEVLFALEKGTRILSVKVIKDKVFVQSDRGYWHVFSFTTRKEIARSPLTIANELRNPRFIPWTENQFLIEETVQDGFSTFKRLWLSDFRGNKKMVMEKYNEIEIHNQPQTID